MKNIEIKRVLESFFKNKNYKFIDVNKRNKNISIPMFLLRLNVVSDKTNEIEEEIKVMISIFSSIECIFFEAFDLYQATEYNRSDILGKLNELNKYAFPGRFIMDDDNSVSYRCILLYKDMEILNEAVLCQIIDSIPPAYYIFLENINGDKNEQNQTK